MRFANLKTWKAFLIPGGILLFAACALAYSDWFSLALPALNFLYYCALGGGLLLAWRFHSSRTFLALAVLFLAEGALSLLAGEHRLEIAKAVGVIAFLVPLDFFLIALTHERGFSLQSIAPVGLFLFVQSVIVSVFWRTSAVVPSLRPHHPAAVPAISLPAYAVLTLSAAGIFLLVRFALTRKPIDSALFWSLGGFYLSLRVADNARISTLYAATAACILAVSIIENSYLLAYHDELTTLPSRRAFNDAIQRLQPPFSIAVVDIDHFKKFNDTYGHDTGDQVLRLVASNLARVTGGGKAFRCGGEEFNILFPGKTTPEVFAHLEQLRQMISSSEFRTRGIDRRQAPRGPDRRNQRRAKKADVIRELAQPSPASLSVTVSIGVATSAGKYPDAEQVLHAADKALYRAKQNGRNRVETASARRQRSKAAVTA